jgi:hypothetical protein
MASRIVTLKAYNKNARKRIRMLLKSLKYLEKERRKLFPSAST